MVISASTEFVSLCEAQLNLLAQTLGTSLGVVYLTEGWQEGAANVLLPVATYPPSETIAGEFIQQVLPASGPLDSSLRHPLLPSLRSSGSSLSGSSPSSGSSLSSGSSACPASPGLLPDRPNPPQKVNPNPISSAYSRQGVADEGFTGEVIADEGITDEGVADGGIADEMIADEGDVDEHSPEHWQGRRMQDQVSPRPETSPQGLSAWNPDRFRPLPHQVVLPLRQGEFILGFLSVDRDDRPWSDSEYGQLEQVAQSLALARLLDQRLQWLQERYQHQEQQQQRRQDILDTLLHQFKNPLTALKTFGKLLHRRLRAGDRNRSVAESILRESDRLQSLVQQMNTHLVPAALALDAPSSLPEVLGPVVSVQARVKESDKEHSNSEDPKGLNADSRSSALVLPPPSQALLPQPMTPQPTDLWTILEPVLEGAQAIAQEWQLTLNVEKAEDLDPVRVDGFALREVLSNLLDNALKYTPPGGTIGVWLGPHKSDPHWQGIVISDTGPGIPAEDLRQLFQRGYRGRQAQGTIPGTGLGLAIAKELVEQMHGRLEVLSPAPSWHPRTPSPGDSGGTAFLVWFPEDGIDL